ncbi:uncharacterized protein LY89DRAFT_712929 [Mollisia scopiformis]|uniref:Uncharacterized protein n=1 Tax=Mollisia scopiformis TaxID=149040 RepID=A0A194XVE3_MOLSC|nr:uncharacterized protein LY89DRAFT_712929 [Mollisia scopiformis]KUJ23979.1 hypothetical protein LY89DRAFT_712929 [Mollisia scopiformis]
MRCPKCNRSERVCHKTKKSSSSSTSKTKPSSSSSSTSKPTTKMESRYPTYHGSGSQRISSSSHRPSGSGSSSRRNSAENGLWDRWSGPHYGKDPYYANMNEEQLRDIRILRFGSENPTVEDKLWKTTLPRPSDAEIARSPVPQTERDLFAGTSKSTLQSGGGIQSGLQLKNDQGSGYYGPWKGSGSITGAGIWGGGRPGSHR